MMMNYKTKIIMAIILGIVLIGAMAFKFNTFNKEANQTANDIDQTIIQIMKD